MKNELKIKLGVILVLIGLSIYALWPSIERYYVLGREKYEALQQSDPARYQELNEKSLHLGLDLQGGMYLLLGVRTEEVLDRELESRVNDVKDWLGKDQLPFLDVKKVNATLEVGFSKYEELSRARDKLQSILGKSFKFATRSDAARQILVVQADASYVTRIEEDAFNQVMETLRNRIDQLGVAEPQIQRQGLTGSRILIQLPGLKDPDQAKRVIGKVAELQFRIVLASNATKEPLMTKYPGGCPDKDPADQKEIYTCPDNTIIVPGELPGGFGESRPGYYHLEANVPASGRDLESASQGVDQYGKPAVHFTVKSASSEAFGRLTRDNLGKQMAIVLDSNVKSAPTLQGRITRNGEITGSFTSEEAYELALTLRSGALPASVEYLEQRSVGASLGDDSIRQGKNSFIVATLLVIVFMFFYYRTAGVNAVISLAVSMLMIMAGLALFGATLTMPGIAGLVLTVGMGVDANVLIFERMRDELKLGRTFRAAVGAGFEKAFSAIADSNATTVIAAALLFQFGTGSVRGFAVTLTLGVIATMFGALWISRVLFELKLNHWKNFKLRFANMLHWIGLPDENDIDFFRFRHKAIGLSVALTILGVLAMGYNSMRTGNMLNWGIDFSGGALLEVGFDKPVNVGEIRSTLEAAGFQPTIQEFGDERTMLVRTLTAQETIAANKAQYTQRIQQEVKLAFQLDPEATHAEILLAPGEGVKVEDLKAAVDALKLGDNTRVSVDSGKLRIRISEVTDRMLQALKAHFEPGNPVTERRTETVGPQVGSELKTSAIWALTIALIAQLIYITFRFELRYAVGAILALFHDAWMGITVLAVFYLEIDMSVIAALLTIIGYSINDTIVVFDRVRENTPKYRKEGFIRLINVSTNEMLSRTILTSSTVLMCSITLWLLGGEVLKSFAVCLTVGVLTGTYSSIYVAAPLAYYWEQWQSKRAKRPPAPAAKAKQAARR
jgi:SecD/SecF fusion protein